ncbi:putative nuclease HARBI1 [Exaiptasia diaphana]|uniref:DDE Tnp4 domain-containing protein n=1 Tax=Exaiptasia diaphana TaxID=2652724 RepID=A0A913WWQ0_EXADI|nr:putative nuclease HARBI1 [Exaiptasia diaphana]
MGKQLQSPYTPCIQVVGSVDGFHIPILKPNDSPEDYINRKKFHSIILQALVDSNYLFRDIYVGWPDKVHDSRVFKNSSLFTSCCNRSFLPQGLAKVISGQAVPPLIIGDSAYGLQDWLMRPFKDHGLLTREETKFNHVLSVTRMVVENAFGRLKGRFRCLGKRLDLCLENCVLVTSACCILHNFCELRNEEFDPLWLNGVNIHNFHPGNAVYRQDRNAVAIRDPIKSYLA